VCKKEGMKNSVKIVNYIKERWENNEKICEANMCVGGLFIGARSECADRK